MASNPAIALWLQSNALVGRVAELGSLGTHSMNILPKTGTGWIRLIVLPMQVYVALAWLALAIYMDAAGRYRSSDFNVLIVDGYSLCFVGLCAGAWFQRRFGDGNGSRLSIVTAVAAVILLPLCLPVLSKT